MSERKVKAGAEPKRKKRNNFGKGTQLKFGRNGPQEDARRQRAASRKASLKGTVAAFAAMILLLGGGGLALNKLDRQEIPQTELRIRIVDAPPPVLDIELVKRGFAYIDAAENSPDGSLLTVNGGSYEGRLQPVYNAVFSRDGLQIASLADRSLKCRADAVQPLAEMLGGFYDETELRTVMINSAYTEDGGEGQTGGLIVFGQYLKDTDSRRPFTLEGNYSWFTEHSWEYGFIQRYPLGAEAVTGKAVSESEFRYVGRESAQIMHDNELCLEQLEAFMKQHTLDDPIVYNEDTVVYSQPADGEIAVPASQSGEFVPFGIYYLGKDQSTVLIVAKPTEEFYSIPEPESEYIVYRQSEEQDGTE